MLYGPGSAGKSLLAQQLATACAAGLPSLGLNIEPGIAIYVTCEDTRDSLHWRQEHICRALGVNMIDLAGKLFLSSLKGHIGNELATFGTDSKMTLTPAFGRLRSTLGRYKPSLVMLDNVAHLFAGNENARPDVTRFVNALNNLAEITGAAIILLGHPNKAGDEWSGSTAWNNVVRSRLWLEHDETSDVRSLTLPKANNSPKGDVVTFYWNDWAFVREEDLGSARAKELAEGVMASADNKLFLDCLRERIKQHRAVSEKRGPTFAPTEFAKMAESKRIGKRRLEAAMDRLFRIEAIERAELWNPKSRRCRREQGPTFNLV